MASVLVSLPFLVKHALPRGYSVSYAWAWSEGFLESLRQGVVYPRWIGEMSRGLGAPTFIFYPPLGYYVLSLAALATGSLFTAWRIMLVLVFFGSGLSFLALARTTVGIRAATLGALLYILFPYHLIDLYKRFAYAELFAFVWLPLVVLGVRRLALGPSWRSWLLFTFAYAALVLTHPLTAYTVVFAAAPWGIALALWERRPQRIALMAAGGAFAILLCAVYLLPARMQRNAVHFEWLTTGRFDYRTNFLFYQGPRASLSVGRVIPTLVLGAALVAGAILVLRARTLTNDPGRRLAVGEGLVAAALGAFAWLMQTELSQPLWAGLPGLPMLQFPWRFGAIQILATAFAVACALDGWSRVAGRSPLRLALTGLLGILLSASLFHAALTVHRASIGFDPSRTWKPTVPEHVPKNVENWRALRQIELRGRAALRSREGEVDVLEWQSEAKKIRITAAENDRLQIRSFAYPGWVARMDGRPVPIHVGSRDGLMEVDAPRGKHELELQFEPGADRRTGAWISALTLLFLIVVPLAAGARRRMHGLAEAGPGIELNREK